MGTWQTFDTTADRRPIVDEALSAGINLFDSSPMYQRAEDALAKALDGRRDNAIIATKIWTSSPAEGRQQAGHALQRFGRVEIYQVHNLVNWKVQLKMLEALRGEGKVVAVGATHYDPGAFDDLCDVMRTGRLHMIQVPYNPRRREAERRVFPLAAELGLGSPAISGSAACYRRPRRRDVRPRTPAPATRPGSTMTSASGWCAYWGEIR